ncbi:ankyrin repeat and SAM domain-containing protein 6-like [Senna tora]|uniref:Ankyrin repeat and SAM domain-containing protein 6-like n=1 Tax=Senna tora TaxID=362788 RepID=A0A834WQM2_9FABA|nr:ankyrin repeat and SAM domain-containing protein 6-like [Senna tora]
MYADRVEAGTRSVKERLNGNFVGDSTRQRQITGKRQREDDKWEHDLFEDDEPRISNRKVTAQDLRLKLQKKGLHPAFQSGKSSVPVVRDLRERLSGTITPQPKKSDPLKSKVEIVKPSSKTVSVEASASQIKRAANPASKKKVSYKAVSSVDGFLQSLGLEKYLLIFQAEEVDMAALKHMTDNDLKAIGIPMGPRKKILLAIESKG